MFADEGARGGVHCLCVERALVEGNVAAQGVATRMRVANAIAVGARKRAEAGIKVFADDARAPNGDVAGQNCGEALDE